MDSKQNQNLRVIARRLNTEIDEKYISVLKSKVKMEDWYWASRTGSMLLAASNHFFKEGIRGQQAYELGRVAAKAFHAINHSDGTPNIGVEVAKAAGSDTLLPLEILSVQSLLVDYFSAREKEKSSPSVANAVLRKLPW